MREVYNMVYIIWYTGMEYIYMLYTAMTLKIGRSSSATLQATQLVQLLQQLWSFLLHRIIENTAM